MKKIFIGFLAVLAFADSAVLFSANPKGKASRRGGDTSRARLQKKLNEQQQGYQLPLNRVLHPVNSADAQANARSKQFINFVAATNRGDWKTAFTILNATNDKAEKKLLLLAIDDRSGFNALFDAVVDASEKIVRMLAGLYKQLGINIRDMRVHGMSLLDMARAVHEGGAKPRKPIIKFLKEEVFFDEAEAAAAEEAAFDAQAPATEEDMRLMEQMLAGSGLEGKE